MEEHFYSLCNALPHNYQFTIDKLKTRSLLLKGEEVALSKLISSVDVRKINEKILTCLIVKLCYSSSGNGLVRLCEVMDELSDSTSCVQQFRHGECIY